MTNAANSFAAFEACLPAAYEVSCRIRTGSPTSFWLDSPRTVASRHSIGSPVPRRRGLGRQAATRRRHAEGTGSREDVNRRRLPLGAGNARARVRLVEV